MVAPPAGITDNSKSASKSDDTKTSKKKENEDYSAPEITQKNRDGGAYDYSYDNGD